jgi:hypothetical protein
MFQRRNLITMAVVILGLSKFVSVSHAETPFDFTYCGSSTTTMVSDNKELMVFGLNGEGKVSSNQENKTFDNFTYKFVGVVRVVDGKRAGNGYTKYTDLDGDIIIQEFRMDGMESSIGLLQGTGKWKGITGTGKSVPVTDGKPTPPGTSCRRITGTFDLPK